MPLWQSRYLWTPKEEQPALITQNDSGVILSKASGASPLETLGPKLNYLTIFLNPPSE